MNTPPHDQYLKKTCRYCRTPLPAAFLDLGSVALANSYVPVSAPVNEEFRCPLRTTLCPSCHLVQLTHVVPPDLMFKHYLYVSSTTKTFQKHFADYACTVREKLGNAKNPLAVDIGSNDGLLLACYQQESLRAVGVDPATNLAEEANQKGLRTLNRYFDKACVTAILAEFGKAHAVSGNNVFAHINDIHAVCRNVSELLDKNGIFVIEFPYLGVMLEKMYFDMIYHEHLSYIAVTPLTRLLPQFGMEVFDIQEVASHGGSLRVFIKKKEGRHKIEPVVSAFLAEEKRRGFDSEQVYRTFAGKVMKVKTDLLACIEKIRAEGRSIAGYGAPAKASTIINFCELNTRQIDYVVDDNPLKQNHFVPGTRIPIVSSARLETHRPDFIIIFAWNFAREILGKIEPLKQRGVRFIVPLLKIKETVPPDEENLSYQMI
ncbi:MAG: class I SAM-dependent methyltransferase [Candidatus Omnitrophica bacterium]|nr:class I SAM-dependent methyltransferase [Candidatus Omnitrophota bacterium]MDD5670084.1 class I SAM-dependent methyltransferase [Candidatus Omnitrophota bacterium]